MKNYNFFDELVLCMKEQRLLEIGILMEEDGLHTYVTLQEVIFIRKLVDEIRNELKGGKKKDGRN